LFFSSLEPTQKNGERSALYFLFSGLRFCSQSTGIINMTLAFQDSELRSEKKCASSPTPFFLGFGVKVMHKLHDTPTHMVFYFTSHTTALEHLPFQP
jgi:hypothetical protein